LSLSAESSTHFLITDYPEILGGYSIANIRNIEYSSLGYPRFKKMDGHYGNGISEGSSMLGL
jgi:hypothetical protein